jgi:hypothetical protein
MEKKIKAMGRAPKMEAAAKAPQRVEYCPVMKSRSPTAKV